MKTLIILCACLMVIATGCDMGDMDFDFSLGEPYYPYNPDPFAVSSLVLRLSADTVYYEPEDAAEASGWAEARNYLGDPLMDIPLDLCVSDSNVACVWDDQHRRDSTDADGRVRFTLRCKDCAGEVIVTLMEGRGKEAVVFLPADRIPAFTTCTAVPDTLYIDPLHPDSVTLRLSVMDEEHQPVRGFTVKSPYLNGSLPDCYSGTARTDAAGTVTANRVYGFHVYQSCDLWFPFSAGGLRDSVRVTLMPWDSTRGG